MIGGGGLQYPEGSHKGKQAMSMGNHIAKLSSKEGMKVLFRRQQDIWLYRQ